MIDLKDFLNNLISRLEPCNCPCGSNSIYDNIVKLGDKRIWFVDMSKSPYKVKLILDYEIDRFVEDYVLYKPLENYDSVLLVMRKQR